MQELCLIWTGAYLWEPLGSGKSPANTPHRKCVAVIFGEEKVSKARKEKKGSVPSQCTYDGALVGRSQNHL